MKIAIYIRTSKRDMSPANQKLQLEQHAKLKGWEYAIFEEKESTRETRPIKQEVLNLTRKGAFNGILVWKLDRWARSLQELIMDIDELTSKGKDFIVLTQPIDTTSASGRLFMQILGAFAEFEREIIRERTMAGLERAKAEGKIGGRHKLNCTCGKCKQSKGILPKWLSGKKISQAVKNQIEMQLENKGGLVISENSHD